MLDRSQLASNQTKESDHVQHQEEEQQEESQVIASGCRRRS
jgi:hypothetical protein